MTAAHFVRAGFFLTGAILLAVIYLGIGGWVGVAMALAATIPFSALIIFGMKCRNCGVSYYFTPSEGGSNLTGVNMLHPVAKHCRKCGAAR